MVEIEVHSDGIGTDSTLAFSLALVGSVAWRRRRDPVGQAFILVYADERPLEELATETLHFARGSARPIVVISEPAPEAQAAKYLHAGVDLCLPLLTNGWYLVGSIAALARRTEAPPEAAEISTEIVEATADSPRRLTRLQSELLRYLVSKRGRWISKEELSVAILGHPPRGYDDSTLRVHLSRVRRLLGERGRLIESRRHQGWRWAD